MITIHTSTTGTPWILDGATWVSLYTGAEVSAHDEDARHTVMPPDPAVWTYNRRADGFGELVLPIPGLRGPFHTIAPAVSRMPDGLWRIEPGTMATSGRPWLHIVWNDPDGSDDHGIHVGNTAADSLGCILPGLEPTPNGVAYSAAAMRIIMAVGRGIEGEQWLRVETVGSDLAALGRTYHGGGG